MLGTGEVDNRGGSIRDIIYNRVSMLFRGMRGVQN